MTTNQLPPLPEPDGQMTVTFGIDEKRKVPVFFGGKLTDYALAAIAQQAQETVQADAPRSCPDACRTPEKCCNFGCQKFTPPAPQVPAPVDEREAWLPIEADTVPDRSKPIFWLLVDGSPVLGYFVEIPFREIRDADGRYIDQQDADAFWATQATGDQVEPTHYCELMPPTAPQTKGGEA